MAYQLLGKIKSIGEVEQKSDTFKVRMFSLTTDSDTNYPQTVQLQLTNDKCDAINTLAVGSDVLVSFNLRGREWTGPNGEVKVFNTLDAWRVEAASAVQSAPGAQAPVAQAAAPANQVPVTNVDNGGDDLPF